MTSVDLRPVLVVRRARARLRRAGADERGAVLVVVAGMMVAMLAVAALAIDIGSFYQAQRQAQAAADAGALAGSDVLATDTTGGAAVTTAASSMASTNYPGASTPTVTATPASGTTPASVKVTVSASAPSFFGQFLGFTHANVSASATASSSTNFTPCTSPGNNCYAIFASDTSCAPGAGVTFSGGGDTVTGGVHSNGNMSMSGTGQTVGPTTYGNGTGCTGPSTGGDTFASGPTPQAPITTWPIDYSKILTACGGTGQVACTGPNGTPSYCTKAKASFDFPTDPVPSGNVYCAYGTGNVTDPATWTGLIYFHSGSFGSSGSPINGTWIGGAVDVGRASFLALQASTPSYPVLYAVGSGNCSSGSNGGVCLVAQGSGISGPIFVPNGTIQFNGAGSTSNFLEGKDVTLTGQNQRIIGIGPVDSGPGATSGGGSSSLVQ